MKHYLAVLVPGTNGAWCAHIPDFPGCRAEALSVEGAILAASAAAAAAAQSLRAQGQRLPTPQTFGEVRHHSNGWASESGIKWSNALISLVPLSVEDP